MNINKMILTSFAGISVAIAAFAEGENIVASKKYTDDTFQTKISTGNVLFLDVDGDGVYDADDGDIQLPGLVAYDSTTGALSGTKIGILDLETVYNDEGDLSVYSDVNGYGVEMDNFVPTVRAVANGLQNIWDNMPDVPAALSWTATQTAAVNNYSTAFNGTTNNWPAGDTGKMVTGRSLAKGLALKQNKIPAGTFTDVNHDLLPSVVTTTGTAGVVSQRFIMDQDANSYASGYLLGDEQSFEENITHWGDTTDIDEGIPTVAVVSGALSAKQTKISGHAVDVADSILTDSTIAGIVQKRAIFDGSTSYVAGTHATHIPTMGAVMSAITNGTEKITWSATQTAAVNNYSTTFDGTTNNWVETDAGKLADGTALATGLALKQNKIAATTTNYTYDATNRPNADGSLVATTTTAGTVAERPIVNAATYDTQGALTNGSAIPNITALDTRQKKRVCAGWPDNVAVADRTNANCWLWYFPD